MAHDMKLDGSEAKQLVSILVGIWEEDRNSQPLEDTPVKCERKVFSWMI